MLNFTHTYAMLEISHEAFGEILKKLRDAGYQDQIHTEDGQLAIDMHGLALVPEPPRGPPGET